jgi:hypothetical protein
MGREPASRVEAAVSTLVGLSATVLLVWRARAFFPGSDGLIGADYRWFFPTLMAGHAWLKRNGWGSIPHFTPAFCGGVPLFANPQSVVYSLPQVLLIPFEPVAAMLATLLISATVGAVASYAVLRRCFATSVSAATLGAVMFLLNGFLFYRLVIGHLTYHAFALAPVLAYLVLSSHSAVTPPQRLWSWAFGARVVAGGMVVAYFTYGGALNFQVPLALTVLAALLMLEVRRGFAVAPWLVLAGSFGWGALLSMMKLAPATAFVAVFPRRIIPLFLFSSPLTELVMLLEGLFLPSALPTHMRFREWALLARHEFEFGVSLVPLLLAGAALLIARRQPRRASQPLRWIFLLLILITPLALSVGTPAWGEFLLKVPVINNNTTFVRWWAIYLIPIIIATAVWFDRLTARPALRTTLLVGCTVVVALQAAWRDDSFYRLPESTYAPLDTMTAYRQLKQGGRLPAVTAVGPSASTAGELGPGMLRTNDALLEGRSARPCYEPIFGYFLELTPPGLGIVDGPVDRVTDGRLNLVDPAEYLSTAPLADRTWRFAQTRLSDAVAFADYRPYRWHTPWWMQAANAVTFAALVLSLVVLGGYVFSRR